MLLFLHSLLKTVEYVLFYITLEVLADTFAHCSRYSMLFSTWSVGLANWVTFLCPTDMIKQLLSCSSSLTSLPVSTMTSNAISTVNRFSLAVRTASGCLTFFTTEKAIVAFMLDLSWRFFTGQEEERVAS